MGGRPSLAFGIERFDDGQQFRPRNEGFHPREELLAAGDLFLGRKLRLRETALVDHALKFMTTPPTRPDINSNQQN